MQSPLTPLEFARHAAALYGDREAVVDGTQRWTYAQFTKMALGEIQKYVLRGGRAAITAQ